MKRILICAMAAVLLGTTANADDRTSPYDWNGMYVGGTIGGGWGTSRLTASNGDTTGDFDIDGVLGGATLGFNHHEGMVVFGVEGDFSYSDIDGATSVLCGPSCTTDIEWLTTVRGRVGLALGRYMPFFTGGIAIGKVEGTADGNNLQSETRVGLTFGGGLEILLTDWMSIKGEYLFVDLGQANASLAAVDVNYNADSNHIIRGGVNIQLGNFFGSR